MPLTSLNLATSTNWTESNTVITGFNPTTESDALQFSLTALNLATWNQAYVDSLTITASGTHDIDLRNLSNFVCESIIFTKVISLFVLTTAADITIGPSGTSNALQWFWDDPTAYVTVKAGGCLLWSESTAGAGTTVDSSHHIITITNLSSSVSARVKIVIVGSTL